MKKHALISILEDKFYSCSACNNKVFVGDYNYNPEKKKKVVKKYDIESIIK